MASCRSPARSGLVYEAGAPHQNNCVSCRLVMRIQSQTPLAFRQQSIRVLRDTTRSCVKVGCRSIKLSSKKCFGFGGTPKGMVTCLQIGCQKDLLSYCSSIQSSFWIGPFLYRAGASWHGDGGRQSSRCQRSLDGWRPHT